MVYSGPDWSNALGKIPGWDRLEYMRMVQTLSQTPAKMGFAVTLNGTNVPHGLGWLVLMLGLGAAALHFTARQLSRRDLRNCALAALALGTLILAYLYAQNLRFLSIGAAATAVAYALLFIGTLREYRTP